MKNFQRGFTLIELMIVVAIIGILAAMALPAYQTYAIRAQVAEGLSLAGPLKNAVAAFYIDKGLYPVDNADAGVEAANGYSGRYVNSISIRGAVISIQYGNNANAQIADEAVTLTATGSLGSVGWDCESAGTILNAYLPSACR